MIDSGFDRATTVSVGSVPVSTANWFVCPTVPAAAWVLHCVITPPPAGTTYGAPDDTFPPTSKSSSLHASDRPTAVGAPTWPTTVDAEAPGTSPSEAAHSAAANCAIRMTSRGYPRSAVPPSGSIPDSPQVRV